MPGKRQLALIEAAREKLKLSEGDLGRMLAVAGAARPEDLTRAGFGLVMDQCTSLGFRDPRRPVLSDETLESLWWLSYDRVGLTEYEGTAVLRSRGFVGDYSDSQ